MPVVSVNCDYKKPLRYGDHVIVEASYVPQAAAKLTFQYRIFEATSRELVATGSSVQVFVNAKSFELLLTLPPFIELWKKRWNV